MDITGITANIENVKTKSELAAYKKKILGELESAIESYGKQALQLGGLTNPATFIASFISMLAPLVKTIEGQVTGLTKGVADLTKAFDDKEKTLTS